MMTSTMRALCLSTLLCAGASAGNLRVPEDYSTIQAALVASSNGDVISVAAGTYAELLDFLGKDVVVESRDGPTTTIITGTLDDSVIRFVSGEGPDAILRGFTVTGGGGAPLDGGDPLHRFGGGILILNDSSPRIEGNWIQDNGLDDAGPYQGHWGEGGGIHVGAGCSPEILRNRVQGNGYGGFSASGWGGGIAVVEATPWIHHNRISSNSGTSGGGIACESSVAIIEHNDIVFNVVDWGSSGGGLLLVSGPPVVRDNLIAGNRAYEVNDASLASGGGIHAGSSGLVLERNRIVDNGSELYGGGLALFGTGIVLRDNLIARNIAGLIYSGGKGGGLRMGNGSVLLEGNTFVDNVSSGTGPAMDCGPAGVELDGCIVWSHGSSPIAGTPTLVSYTDLEGGWSGPGTGNLDVDPQFTDAGSGDYSLLDTSPCIDVGTPTRLEPGADLGGTPRVLDGDLDRVLIVDMGALEFSNVHLEVRSDTVPPGKLEFRTTGTAGLRVYLFAGLAPGAALLKPYGSVLIDLGQTWDFFPFGTVPSTQVLDIPPGLPLPLTVYVQELAVKTPGKGGNFSNVVQIDLD